MLGGIEQKARRNARRSSLFSQSGMQPSCPTIKQTALSPFLVLKAAYEEGKYQDKRSENGHHLMRFASNDAAVE